MELNKQEKRPLYYTDINKDVVGQLTDYDIDIDINDKADFKLSTRFNGLTEGCAWFIPNTPYGGFVDTIEYQNDNGKMEYSGPSLQGYLNYVKLYPLLRAHDTNYKYNQDGTFNYSLTDVKNIIDWQIRHPLMNGDVDDIYFIQDRSGSQSDVDKVLPLENGMGAWDAIKRFMDVYQLTVNLVVRDQWVHDYQIRPSEPGYNIGHKWRITMSIEEPILWEQKTYNFPQDGDVKITDYGQSINHLICRGKDEKNQDTRIDLFWDEDGNLQPYATEDNPKHDKDFITWSHVNQVIYGIEEKTDVYENDKATVEAYEPLTKMPSDWSTNFANYYEYKVDENGDYSYQPVEALVPTQNYVAINTQPSDWSTNWKSYYKRRLDGGTYVYEPVEDNTTPKYKNIPVKPRDWKYTYSNYLKREWDGTQYVYNSYSAITEDYYEMQTKQPTYWYGTGGSHTYADYYMLRQDEGDTKPVMHQVDMFYKWVPGRFYTKKSRSYEPEFVGEFTFVQVDTVSSAPAWQTNKYYELKESNKVPWFYNKQYYKKVYYNYPKLVEEGLEYYEKLKRGITPEATLVDDDLRINDIVIITNPITGDEIYCKAKNIIAKINSGTIVTQVTVGV